MTYNKITGKGKPSNKERRDTTGKGVRQLSEEQIKELLEYCKKNHLYTSGGTDYHGTKRPSVEIGVGKGNLRVPDEIIKDWYNG